MSPKMLNDLLALFAKNDGDTYQLFGVTQYADKTPSLQFAREPEIKMALGRLIKEGYLSTIEIDEGFVETLQYKYTPHRVRYYQITYEGKRLWMDGGYQLHVDRVEYEKKMQWEKFQAELEFVQQSKKMISFQKKQGIFTVIVSAVTLLFVILSFLNSKNDKQTKALNEIKIELQKLKEAIKPDSAIH